MEEGYKRALRKATSASEIVEFARAEGVPLDETLAGQLFAQYHPPGFEQAQQELDNVTGGCASSAAQEFREGQHVMHIRYDTCGQYQSSDEALRPVNPTCPSPYFLVESYTLTLNVPYYNIRCPWCGYKRKINDYALRLV